MVKKAATKSKAAAKSAPTASGGKIFRRIFLSVIYLLAAYGLHNIIADCSPVYRSKSREYFHSAGEHISTGAKSVENSIALQPTVVIKTPATYPKLLLTI